MSTTGRILLLLALLLSYFGASAHPAFACSCVEPGPPESALREATVVFAGRVREIPAPPVGGMIDGGELIPITFEVSEVWKGAADPFITVRTERDGAACGYSFAAEREYLVYARVWDGLLRTGLCTRTALLVDAEEDLAALGEGQVPDAEPAPAAPAGTESTSSFALPDWGIALLVALLLLVASLVVSWKRQLKGGG